MLKTSFRSGGPMLGTAPDIDWPDIDCGVIDWGSDSPASGI